MGQYEHVSWSKSTTGFGYVRIRRADLMHILYEELEVAVIRIFFGKSLLEIEESNDKITAKFADNTSDTADLLLGCDGLHSAVRKLYVDPGHEPEYTGISNIFSLVSTANLSRSAKTLENLNATLTTDGLVAISPCTTSAEVLYWFLSREIELPEVGDTRDDWEQRGREEVYALKGALLSLLEGGGGEFSELQKEIIDKTSVTKFYPVFRLPLGGRWSRSRCLIIGDAAHAM
jgi:2-polyprenyl-6-methoxyphenol hydroxylase-like FAD-dependent oxidoreductase